MNDINKLETLDELYRKAREADNFDWLEYLHTNKDCWEKTKCPFNSEIFTFADDDGYNEVRGYLWDYDIHTVTTACLTVDRVMTDEKGPSKTTWEIDVEMFVYKNYIYTISSEHIVDAQTFTCQSIMRRPLNLELTKS